MAQLEIHLTHFSLTETSKRTIRTKVNVNTRLWGAENNTKLHESMSAPRGAVLYDIPHQRPEASSSALQKTCS